MNLPTNILVPVDFSEFSEHALDYAVALAAKLEAKVHLLHAVEIPVLGVPEVVTAWAAVTMDSVINEHQNALDKLADPRRKLARIGEVMLRTGDARDLIIHACEEVNADLIVMDTHGRRGLRRTFLGSVAESVVRSAPCPVLTIRNHK